MVNKIAFVFPGQGAQYVGMGKDLIEGNPLAKNIMEKAKGILKEDLENIIINGPKEILDRTENTQPAILTISYILTEMLKNEGITPKGVAGLSLGEYSALVCSEVLTFEDALPLVRKRAQLMQTAVPVGVGGMVALVGTDIEGINNLLADIKSGYVAVANYNCPGQYVVTGEVRALEEVVEKAKSFGVRRAIPLDVSGPFHSKLLSDAGKKLGEYFNSISFNEPVLDTYNNVNAKTYTSVMDIKTLLVKQVSSSVLWQQTIENMIKDGFTGFVEVGPQKTLSALIKKISKDVWVANVEDVNTFEEFIKGFKEGNYEA